jgi:hypothetical protein
MESGKLAAYYEEMKASGPKGKRGLGASSGKANVEAAGREQNLGHTLVELEHLDLDASQRNLAREERG